MKKGFFITATDTGVGKTIIAGAVAKALIFLGLKTAVMKPIETGCTRVNTMLMPSDGLFLKNISGMNETINIVTPCMYEQPLAPLAASEIEGRAVDLNGIFEAYDKLSSKYDAMVVEGVGGLYVPILKDYFVSDLAKQMKLPLIIVARPTLGTINHTLLTIHYALSKGIDIAGIVLNHSSEPEANIAEETNQQTLQGVTEVPIIGNFPFVQDFDKETIDRTAIKSLEMNILKKYVI